MKKVIICICITLGVILPSVTASASSASKFNHWVLATNPVIQKFTHDVNALQRFLHASDATGAMSELINISHDGTSLGRHTNSGDSLLNSDMKTFARAVINLSSVGLKTLTGGSLATWTSALNMVALDEQATTNELNYDLRRWK